MAEAERWKQVAQSLWDLVAEGYTKGGEAEVEATSPPARCEAPMSPPNPEWRWLSPLEEQIIALMGTDYRTAEDLAAALKIRCSSDFRYCLRNMVARCILDSSGEGYRMRAS